MELVRKAFQMKNPDNDWRITLANTYLELYFDETVVLKKKNKELVEILNVIK
jgi:hypothetical protein